MAARGGGAATGDADKVGRVLVYANQKYDRDFLLSPEKRNQIVELWEVEKYGADGKILTIFERICSRSIRGISMKHSLTTRSK